MPAGALSYQSNGDIIFYRAREATASVWLQARIWALVGARTIRFSGMAGSVVHLLEQPRPGCDRVLPHSPEPGRRAGRADRNLRSHERVRGECDAKDEGPASAQPRRCRASRRRSAYLSESGCSASSAGTRLRAPFRTSATRALRSIGLVESGPSHSL